MFSSLISTIALLCGIAITVCFFFLCSNVSQIRKSLDRLTPIEPGEHKIRDLL